MNTFISNFKPENHIGTGDAQYAPVPNQLHATGTIICTRKGKFLETSDSTTSYPAPDSEINKHSH